MSEFVRYTPTKVRDRYEIITAMPVRQHTPNPVSRDAEILLGKVGTVLTEGVTQKSPIKRNTIVDFTPNEQRKGYEYFFSREWLIEEVARERQKPIPPGEVPWYHLAGTGFWVKEQVAQLMSNIAKAGKENFSDVLEGELSKVKEDIIFFEHEYLKQMVSLQWNLAWKEENGEKRIIAPNYRNKFLAEVTREDERDGVVYKTLFGDKKKRMNKVEHWLDRESISNNGEELDMGDDMRDTIFIKTKKEEDYGVEGWLRTAPPGSFAILVSPKGWSGLKDSAWRDISYPETQIYAIKTLPDGTLQAYTFRLDATIEQNEAFQRSLGLTIPESPDQRERIKNTFKNVALITPEDAKQAENEGRRPIRSFEDIIDVLQDSVGGKDTAYGERTFDEMRAFLKYPERFSQVHPLTEKLIARAQDYVRWRLYQGGTFKEIETDLQIALATIPTQLHKLYSAEEAQKITTPNERLRSVDFAQRSFHYEVLRGGVNYKEQHDQLKKLPGCAGGSTETDGKTQVTSMGSSKNGEVQNINSSDMKCVTCPFCSETVDAIVTASEIECPSCHKVVSK